MSKFFKNLKKMLISTKRKLEIPKECYKFKDEKIEIKLYYNPIGSSDKILIAHDFIINKEIEKNENKNVKN